MSDIFVNKKVNQDYKIYICVQEEKNDMLASVNEHISEYGYSKVYEGKDENNYIVIIKK